MKKLMIVSLVLLASIGALVWVGVEAASIPVVRIGELKGGAHGGVDVQVDGKVVAIESYSPLLFSVASEKDPENVLVVSSERSVPENFNVGRNVSLRGEYQKEKSRFEAYRITTQCPSKYEASKETEKQVRSSAAGGYGSPGSTPIPELLEKGPAPPKLAN